MKSNDKINFMQGGSIMVSEKQKISSLKWDKDNTKTIGFKFMLKKDADILEFLDNSECKIDVIRAALRLYMQAQKKDQ